MSARCFVLSAMLFGSLFVFVVPPFQVADEFNHFYRAWQVSDGILVGIRTPDNRLGGDLPISVAKITQPFRSLPFHPENQIKSSTIFNHLSVPLVEDNRAFVDFTNTAIYAPSAYLPQVVAILIGKFLKIPPLSIFYFSRLLTLFFWICMIYLTLKTLPSKNNLFAALALLPSSLFIHASTSGDVVTNACSFLLMALFLKKIVEKNKNDPFLGFKNVCDLSGIFMTSLIVSLNKPAYFPLIFLIVFIKKEHFNGFKNKVIITTTLILSNLSVMALWSKKIAPLYIRFEDYNPAFRVGQQLNEQVDPSLQISFILHNPLMFTQIATFSLIKTLPNTLIHYIGKFGWEKNYLPLWLIASLMILLLIHASNNTNKNVGEVQNLADVNRFRIWDLGCRCCSDIPNPKSDPLSIKAKFSLFCIGILLTYSFAAAMYAIWSPIGSTFIDNLGGKYFIPIYPLFFMALPTFDLSQNRIIAFLAQPKVLFGALYLSLMWSVVQVITRYYLF